jgi:hypothetical protein
MGVALTITQKDSKMHIYAGRLLNKNVFCL